MKKNTVKTFFVAAILLPSIYGNAQPFIQTATSTDMTFTCCYKQISMINCDMIEINNHDKLWAVVYNGLDYSGAPVAELSIWRNNSPVGTIPFGAAYGNAQNADVVLTHTQSGGIWGNDYLACVVFESDNGIYYETYAINTSGFPTLSPNPVTSLRVDNNGICILPHIDAFADRNLTINGGPALRQVAIAWSQRAANGFQEIMCTISDNLVSMNPISTISVDSAIHSDIAAVTYVNTINKTTERSVFAIITQAPVFGQTPVKISRADYNYSNSMALSVTENLLADTFHHAFQPRIDGQNLYNPATGSITWQAAVQVSDLTTPLDFYIALFNSAGASNICRIDPAEDHGSVAVTGRGTQGYSGIPGAAIGRDYYTVGYYSTYTHNSTGNDGDFYVNGVDIDGPNKGFLSGNYDELCSMNMYAPISVQTTTDTRLALSTCSNTGNSLLAVWVPFERHPTTGWNLRYKLTAGNSYAFKTSGITSANDLPGYSIYPNPATTDINIPGLKQANYTITNTIGQAVVRGIVSAGNTTVATINITNLEPGIYLLILKEDDREYKLKFVKE